MAAEYNEYVLDTAVTYGVITPEQKQSVSSMLATMPGLSAVEVLYEQQIIDEPHRKWFYQEVLHQPVPGLHSHAGADAEPSLSHDPAQGHGATASNVDSEAGKQLLAFLAEAQAIGASDIHLGPDFAPTMRYRGALVPLRAGAPALTPRETEAMGRAFLTPKQAHEVEGHGSVEFCYEAAGISRFRTSVVRQRRGWELIFRLINSKVPTLDSLGMPEALRSLTKFHNGLILVTGPVGSGKSTTLAAMIDEINRTRHDHILTLEDPIEYVFEPQGCQVSQREVHTNTDSFGTALRAALREDPDVIMIGEMRDLETIQLAITASETGHLVLGTLHTGSAARTLDRLLDVFPIEQQSQIRTMVSESIRGIVCQQLIPKADGTGRVAALEIMLNNPAVGNLIRESKTFMLPGVIQTGVKQGMQLMDDVLLKLLDKGDITAEEAYNRADNKKAFAQELARRQ
ncbi:twitching motility protein PilT [Verrucomicrobium sp. GAS474]|uniref:type IV pilus twitching motility protein PilT n=1 Tax=Verrucomicrobium sp. GAS474 TaxID=1882831 RepID=UPI00087B96FC|nr:type IV pilus twitching motility protein PilT [Verrucomicrobium sp. GAS474]SDU01000.1 twitching motility protein PilT [Verrucomicrobium sp. GAS474]